MVGRIIFIGRAFLVHVIFAILINDSCRGQQSDDSELVATYQTEFEKMIGGFYRLVSPPFTKNETAEDSKVATFSAVLKATEKSVRVVFPGTMWCGSGNTANKDTDIGPFKEVDSCCRDHDKCPLYIAAGLKRGRLYNNATFARSHCSCENEFHKCLKRLGSSLASGIGMTYFNFLRPQCFVLQHPIVSCSKQSQEWFRSTKCLEYTVDRKKPKKLQWFDTPDF